MNTLKVRNIELGAGVPKTIVPIVAKTRQAILDKAAEITRLPADLIEWRADFYEDLFNIPTLLETLHEMRKTLGQTPILFTIRTKPEGGEIAPSFEDYAGVNLAIAKSGDADLVDVEMFWGNADWNGGVSEVSAKLVDELHKAGCKVVGSRHSFSMTPGRNEIASTLVKQQKAGADVPKVAVMPNSDADVVTLIGASVDYKGVADRPFLTISMGPRGMVSRISCELSGSCITFGAAGQASAPGQIQVKDLKDALNMIHTAQGN